MSSIAELSPKAYYLLGLFFMMSDNITDTRMIDATGWSINTYYKYKKELKDKKYLAIKQTGKGTYKYTLGKQQ